MRQILVYGIFFLFSTISSAQEQLTLEKIWAYKHICTGEADISSGCVYSLDKKYYDGAYSNAKLNKDEFQMNKYYSLINEKYQLAKKEVRTNKEYYLTEFIPEYTYDFNKKGVSIKFGGFNELIYLDMYEEGNVFTKYDYSHSNPSLFISNYENIPTLYEMPEKTAENSFNSRKGNRRLPFKLKYYFKFWNCNEVKVEDKVPFGEIEVYKIELIDEVTGYIKSYDIKPVEYQRGNQSNNIESKKSNIGINPKSVTDENSDFSLDNIALIYGNDTSAATNFYGSYKGNSCKKESLLVSENIKDPRLINAKYKGCGGFLFSEDIGGGYYFKNGVLYSFLNTKTNSQYIIKQKNGTLVFKKFYMVGNVVNTKVIEFVKTE